MRRVVLLSVVVLGCARGPSDHLEHDSGSTTTSHGTTDPSSGGPASSATAPDASGSPVDPVQWLCPTDPEPTPRFELGWDYKDGWIDLQPGGPITLTVGGQGAWMVPLGVRGDGFCVPADPSAYDHVPTLDIRLEVEPVGDPEGMPETIAAVTDFPVSFRPIDAGGLGYTFIPMIIADGFDVEALHGRPASIRAELRPRDVTPLSFDQGGVLMLSD